MRGLSLVAAGGGHSSSWCVGLSLSRPLLLWSTGSRRAGSVVVAHGPSCSVACGILPYQGSNPCPLHWQADSQPLHHQGSPNVYSCKHHLNQDTEHICHSESCLIPLSVNPFPLRQLMLDVYHHILLVLHVLECHINGTIHYAFLCVSLLPLNIMFVKFNYVAFDVSKSFFLFFFFFLLLTPYLFLAPPPFPLPTELPFVC